MNSYICTDLQTIIYKYLHGMYMVDVCSKIKFYHDVMLKSMDSYTICPELEHNEAFEAFLNFNDYNMDGQMEHDEIIEYRKLIFDKCESRYHSEYLHRQIHFPAERLLK